MIKLNGKNFWLLNLRWIAIAALFITPVLLGKLFSIIISAKIVYIIACLMTMYNLVLYLLFATAEKLDESLKQKRMGLLNNVQIFMDLACLAVLIHYAGGVENPFIFYFIFHIIIAGILLDRKNAFLQTVFAVLLFLGIAAGEYAGILKHHPLTGYPVSGAYRELVYVIGVSVVFISTLFISFYFASNISSGLKDREKRLREANLSLEEKDRVKSEYVLRVTHDIKGHLAAIQSCIYTVRDGYAGTLNDKQKELLVRADERTDKLMQFVKALLELTVMRLQKADAKEFFNPVEIIKSTAAIVEPSAKMKDIQLEIILEDNLPGIEFNKTEFQAVIMELLTNATRYTPNNGKVSLQASYTDKLLTIRISDTGIGIPVLEKDKIFEEFYRAQNARQWDGASSGLGLAMVKHVIEKHKGRIVVEPNKETGTIFSIKIPVL